MTVQRPTVNPRSEQTAAAAGHKIVRCPQTAGASQESLVALRNALAHAHAAPAPHSDLKPKLVVVRLMVELGLGEAAMNQVEQWPAAFRQSREIRDLTSSIRTLPQTVVDTSHTSAQYHRHADLLFQYHGEGNPPARNELDQAAQTWRSDRVVMRDRLGRLIVATIQSETGRWIYPDLADHHTQAESVSLPHLAQPGALCPPPYVLQGIDPPDLWLRIWRDTADGFQGHSPMIYSLVPEMSDLLPALHLHDLADILADERIVLLIGADAPERLRDKLLQDQRLTLPKYVLTMPKLRGAFTTNVRGLIDSVDHHRTADLLELRSQAGSHYEGLSPDYWARRYQEALAGQGSPLRIMIPVSRYTTYIQYSARQLSDALVRFGCEVRIITERDSHAVISAWSHLETYANWKPDLLIEIDHLRAESRHIIPEQLPHVCWVQDRLPNLFSTSAGREIGPLDLVVGLAVRQLCLNYGYPPDQCAPMLNGTDPQVYDSAPLPESELAPHRCDVAYVSNQSDPPEVLAAQLSEKIAHDETERRFLAEFFHRLRLIFYGRKTEPSCLLRARDLWHDYPDQLENAFTDQGLKQVFEFFCLPLADRLHRHQALQWTIKYCRDNGRKLHLYGQGWDEHETTRPFARGVVSNGRELRAVYQAASVHLHMSIHGSLHQRVFDGFASGGLVLCRRTRGDLQCRMFAMVSSIADDLGRPKFTLHEAPRLKTWLEREFHRDLPLALGQRWDLDGAPWSQWREPALPCNFRSFDELIQEPDEVVFSSEQSLRKRLDALLGNAKHRRSLIQSIRDRIVGTLSSDAIARRIIERMAQHLDTVAARAPESVVDAQAAMSALSAP